MPDDSELDLRGSEQLQIQFRQDDAHVRYSVRVIGQLAGSSILVTAPMINGRLRATREGQVIVARGFSGAQAWAFSSRILRVCTQPYPYLHLSVPDRAEQVLVRKSQRVNVLLGGWVQKQDEAGHGSKDIAVVLSDLSITGAMIEAKQPLGEVGTVLRLRFGVNLPDIGRQHCEAMATIRCLYSRSDDSTPRYGVEFDSLDATAKLTLRAYVFGQILGADLPRE